MAIVAVAVAVAVAVVAKNVVCQQRGHFRIPLISIQVGISIRSTGVARLVVKLT